MEDHPLVHAMLDDLQLNATTDLVEKITTPHPGNPLGSLRIKM